MNKFIEWFQDILIGILYLVATLLALSLIPLVFKFINLITLP